MICANREMRTHPQPSMLSTYKNQIVRSAKCEKGNGIRHMSGESVYAKCEKGKVEVRERELREMRNTKLDICQKTGHFRWREKK